MTKDEFAACVAIAGRLWPRQPAWPADTLAEWWLAWQEWAAIDVVNALHDLALQTSFLPSLAEVNEATLDRWDARTKGVAGLLPAPGIDGEEAISDRARETGKRLTIAYAVVHPRYGWPSAVGYAVGYISRSELDGTREDDLLRFLVAWGHVGSDPLVRLADAVIAGDQPRRANALSIYSAWRHEMRMWRSLSKARRSQRPVPMVDLVELAVLAPESMSSSAPSGGRWTSAHTSMVLERLERGGPPQPWPAFDDVIEEVPW